MDSESPRGRAPRIVAREANITNAGGDYVDTSVTNVTNVASVDNTLNITNVTNNVPSPSTRELDSCLLKLERFISRGAAHDSYERGGLDAPKCHPETRAAVQAQIMGWIGYGDEGKGETPTMIMWLSGPAGAGKTAIAGSIADTCQENGWLAGTFFFSAFSGPPDRRSKLCVVPTLAYHLIHHKSISGLRERILSAIVDNPSVFDKRLREQFEILILGPLRGIPVGVDRTSWPKVIIIDGLEECGAAMERNEEAQPNRRIEETNQQEVISVLAHASKDPMFPFRIMVVSRPEPAIRVAISTSFDSVMALFLDEKYNPDADIALFLNAKFAEIRRRFGIPASWPSQRDLDALVGNASGQFIYVATVIRFIASQDGSTREHPRERLKRVLEWKSLGNSEPLSTLETLYKHIIGTSPDPRLAIKWLITIHEVRNHHDPWLNGFEWSARDLLESYPGEMEYLLGTLTSLVDLGPGQGERAPSFSFYHKSFGDFLEDDRQIIELYAEPRIPRRTPTSSQSSFTESEKIAMEFLAERSRAVLRHRGSQGSSNRLLMHPHDFGVLLSKVISPHLSYGADDVDWWWSCLSDAALNHHFSAQYHQLIVNDIFSRIHKDCRWHGCLESCKVWRKGIPKHCDASREWRVLPGARPRFFGLWAAQPKYEEVFLGGYSYHIFFRRLPAPDDQS